MIDFDALRAAHPQLGLTAYAMTPGGPVTLEVLTPLGETFPFKAPTLAEAVALSGLTAFTPPPPVKVDIFG